MPFESQEQLERTMSSPGMQEVAADATRISTGGVTHNFDRTNYLIHCRFNAIHIQLKLWWIAVAVGGLQFISSMTKFCPVYFILNKLMPNTDPIQNRN